MVALFCLYLYVLVYACVFVYQDHVWLRVICDLFSCCVSMCVRVLSFEYVCVYVSTWVYDVYESVCRSVGALFVFVCHYY